MELKTLKLLLLANLASVNHCHINVETLMQTNETIRSQPLFACDLHFKM